MSDLTTQPRALKNMKCTVVLYYYLGLLQTMTALLPIFNNVTLVCDDSLTIQPHKVIL